MKSIIFGAGENGKHAIKKIREFYQDQIELMGFADNQRKKEFTGVGEVDIKNSIINRKETAVIIAVSKRKSVLEIYQQLSQLGYKLCYLYLRKDNEPYEEKDFFENECIRIEGDCNSIIAHIELHAVDCCNLNCSGCTHFSPVFDKIIPDTRRRINDLHEIHAISTDIISIFILGGEPLLNPEICTYIEESRKIFPKADIQIVTNGLLLLKCKQEFWNSVYNNKVIITISEYQPTHLIIDEIVNLLKEKKVGYIIRKYDKKEKFNKPLAFSKESSFENTCISDGCVSISEGKIARCPTVMYVNGLNGKFQLDYPEIGIYEIKNMHSVQELNSLMEKRIPLCDYCVKNEIEWHKCGEYPNPNDFVSYD